MFKRIVAPVDGSESARRALDLAAEIASGAGAKLVVIHVLADHKLPPDLEHFAEVEHLNEKRAPITLGQRIVDGAKGHAKEGGAEDVETIVVEGDPAEQIVAAAKDADLIVMGTRGLGSAKGLLLGSVSNKVQQLAECPCMTTK